MRRVILAIVGTVAGLVVLLSFKTHSTPATVASPPSASASKAGSSSSAGASTAATTVTGDEAQTIYGPIQVKITVKNGKVTAAQAVQYPQDSPRDQEINSYAVPVLNQEAVSASSAHIDAVSGATYTSGGYVTSLQSALDKAGL